MKILLSFALIFIFAFNSFGSPLIFKITKEINSKNDYVELGTFDALKYKQIRIRITFKPKKPDDSKLGEITIYGIQGDDEIPISGNMGEVIDSPPAKIKVKVKGEGTYSLYVWASL
jgi:hypothetical protein